MTGARQRIDPDVRTHLDPRIQSGGGTTLPEDLLKEQAMRMQLFYAVGVILWLFNFVMDIYMTPQGDRGPYRLLIEASGAVLAGVTAIYARCGRCGHRRKVEAGALLIVPHALLLALLNSWTAQPTTMRPLSGVTVLILFFGMLAPAKPSRILAAGMVAASMDPVGVWLAYQRGLPVPSVLNTFLMFYPNYVCAVLAVAPAQVLYRLARKIREARALGSYQLVERLGQGGMGEVWRARHRILARGAAIKLIRPEMLSNGGRDQAAITVGRFEREAQATAALTSPHTIRLFDFGLTHDGTFYYVMELLDGRDLESLVREHGPLPPSRALSLIRQVCRSLAEAHSMGLIHRDIKPANIYLCRMGLEYDFVKVLDFGLVKHEDRCHAPTLLTAGPVTMGTPAYMAPEVILGQTDVDRRVDVYALGCVAYFLVTGERVFNGPTSMQLLMQHVHDTPVAPSQRTSQFIPRGMDHLILACLQKDPNRRPRSAEELSEMAGACAGADGWDQQAARAWWESHLPKLTRPVSAPALVRGMDSCDLSLRSMFA